MLKLLFTFALTLSSLAEAKPKTLVQRCLSGNEMRDMIERLQGEILFTGDANSVRNSVIEENEKTTIKFEYFTDKECSTAYLTNEAFYEDGVINGEIAYHLKTGSQITCHSERAKADYERLSDVDWDGTTLKQDISKSPTKGRMVLIAKKGTAGGVIIRVLPYSGLYALLEPLKNEEFRPAR